MVTNGLFANWPVAEFTEERFGPNSDMATKNNKVGKCWSEQWMKPIQPGIPDPTTGELPMTDFGASTAAIPEYCSPECKADPSQCPIYLRSDIYSCNGFAYRTPSHFGTNSHVAGGTSEITYTETDFEACVNPDNTRTWMEWQNCIEKRIDGLCEIRCAANANAANSSYSKLGDCECCVCRHLRHLVKIDDLIRAALLVPA